MSTQETKKATSTKAKSTTTSKKKTTGSTPTKPVSAKKAPAKKKATTKVATPVKRKPPIKVNGKRQGVPKKDVIKNFSEANEVIDEGIRLFEQIKGRLDTMLGKASQQIERFRKAEAERGGQMDAIERIVKESNDMQITSARLGRYLRELKDQRVSFDRKVAVLGVMVDLNQEVDRMEHTAGR